MLNFNYHIWDVGTAKQVSGFVTGSIKVFEFVKSLQTVTGNAAEITLVADNKESLQKAIALLTVLAEVIDEKPG